MSEHTPGPWDVIYNGDDGEHIIRMGEAIETPWNHPSEQVLRYDHGLDDEAKDEVNDQWCIADANARLIAAAPDLLAACEAYCAAYDAGTGTIHVNKYIRQAIARAKGETA